MWKNILSLLAGIFMISSVWGQADSVAVRLQKIKTETADSVRLIFADQIPAFLEKIEYGKYAELPAVQFLGYKECVNRKVELFSWAIPLQKGQMFYNWFRFKAENKIYVSKSFSAWKGEQMGWLYYDLVGFEHQQEDYFLLLGWNKTFNSNRKIVQVVRFEPDGSMSYNHPFMRKGNSRSISLSFEYASDGSMMLKQDKKGKRVVFDHLAPADKKYEGYFMFYGPDASYDALILRGGEWWYEEKVKD